VGQQFVKLQNELLLLRHGGDVAAEAGDHEDLDGALLNFLDNVGGELARRNLRRVDLPNDKLPLIDARPKVEAHCFRARQKGVDALVELIDRHLLSSLASGSKILQPESGFSGAGRSGDENSCAARRTAIQQRVKFRYAATNTFVRVFDFMLGCDQSRKDIQAATPNDKVVESGDEIHASEFLNLKPSPCCAKVQRQPG
ncbi:hypothetical protein NS44R_14790, partial [Mammaliicoccus sciuri]